MSAESDDLEALNGVGPATAEKLRDAGYDTYQKIGVANPGDLETEADLGENTAAKAINSAREEAEIGGFESGIDVLERRKQIGYITSGVEGLDDILGGGFETQSVHELHGANSSGKSQFAHQLSVNVQLPEEYGGLERGAIFIDSEDTFRPDRIEQMVEGLDDEIQDTMIDQRGIEADSRDAAVEELVRDVLKNIHVSRAFNSNHQILLGEKAKELANDIENNDDVFDTGIVVVDSLTAHFRAEYLGRGELADRQQKLNKHLHDLAQIADLHNAAVFYTNQVQSNPDKFFGNPEKPIGGNILGHTATFRMAIRQAKGDKRVVALKDAPNRPDGEIPVRIDMDGILPE